MKPYLAYKPSGGSWLGDVPSHWEVARLRFRATLNPAPSRELDADSLVSFLPMEAIGDDGLLTHGFVRAVHEVSSGYTYFEEGDVTIAKITPCFENGKGAVMQGLRGGVGFGTTELIVMRPDERVVPKWLYYLTMCEVFRSPGEAMMLGAGGQKRVPDLFVKDYRAAFPSIVEQEAIAKYLDFEATRIDRLIGEKKSLVSLLLEHRQGVASDVVMRGLRHGCHMKSVGGGFGAIPEHWQLVPLKRFVKVLGGHTPSTENPLFWDGSIPWVSPKDMKREELIDSIDHVTDAAVEDCGLAVVVPGATLVVVRGMILAHSFPVARNLVPVTINQDMKAIRPETHVLPEYLPWLLRGVKPVVLSLTEQSAHGTLALRTDKFFGEPLPIPPLDEQAAIVEFLQVELPRIDELITHTRDEIQLLHELRAATIADAVLGRIDVRTASPADQPAASNNPSV
jgi:type I restriction enzyme S subunit